MDKIYQVVAYVVNFVSDPSFQDRQNWVRKLIGFLSFLSHNVWTSFRVFGFIVVPITNYNPILGLVSFLAFSVTDWIDGKVARMRNNGGENFGAIYDAIVDKIFIIPIIWWWGREFALDLIFALLAAIEFFGNFLLYLFRNKVNSKNGKDIFEHLYIGKVKFSLQVILVVMLWIAQFMAPNWFWWPLWINITLGMIIVLAGFSVACKFKHDCIKFLADFFTLGNLICGLVSIHLAKSEIEMAVALIIISAIFDLLDGYVARKTKENGSKFGVIADDIADFISFGVAPAVVFYVSGVPILFSIIYCLSTMVRLIVFALSKGEAGIFKGFPSTGAAIFLSSLLLWNNPPYEFLKNSIMICSFYEVLFFCQWYHFRKFSDVSLPIQIFFSLAFVISFWLGVWGEFVTFFLVFYFLFFFKPLADEIWKWKNGK